jgi:ABC-type Fe3+/spermidine/putrescine transport system ATPase subunit
MDLAKETAATSVITVGRICKSIGPQIILNEITFEIAAGELLVILGPSGSGKTTLLRIIAGLARADSGDVGLYGRRVGRLPPQQRKLGVVFQDHALFQRMTVAENIAFGLRVQRAAEGQVQETVDKMLRLVRLEEHRSKYPQQLSGGQRQRVALARALAPGPAAMLLDEPFSSLDAVTRSELRREVRLLLRSMNVAALFITHDQEEALELADRIAVLNRGRIEQVGTPFEIYNHPHNEFVATFLGAANVLLARWREGEVALGALRIKRPADASLLAERQTVKLVFRPEDVVLNFQPQLLDTPFYLGRGVIEEVSYAGPTERLNIRLSPWPAPTGTTPLTLVDDTYAEGFDITATRSKWEVTEMPLSIGDPVVVGLKDYRLLPHYPLTGASGAGS